MIIIRAILGVVLLNCAGAAFYINGQLLYSHHYNYLLAGCAGVASIVGYLLIARNHRS